MKVLLLVPPLFKKDRYGSLEKAGALTEPLGLAYLASSLEAAGHKVSILDTVALQMGHKEVEGFLRRKSFQMIGLSVQTPVYLAFQDILPVLKRAQLKAAIVVGGPHMTIMPDACMDENPLVDYGVVGDGEEAIVEIADAILGRRDPSSIKGIFYRRDGKVQKTEARPFRMDIDAFRMPARHLLPMHLYAPTVTYYKKLPSYIIMTSRGCPFRCTYCSRIAGNRIRYHSVNRVLAEIELLIRDYGARDIVFRDDTFTVNKRFVRELCEEMIRRGINRKIYWSCMSRVNCVDREMLLFMRKAGCWSIHYGVESGSQRILDLIKKDITLKQVRDAFRWTREAKIETKAFFMLGLPTETKRDVLRTIAFAKDIDPDWAQFTITTPYPGTELYETAKANGTLKSFNWQDYQSWAGFTDNELVYLPKGWTSESLKAMQPYALRSFYLRPKVILRILSKIRSWSVLKRSIMGARAVVFTRR